MLLNFPELVSFTKSCVILITKQKLKMKRNVYNLKNLFLALYVKKYTIVRRFASGNFRIFLSTL